MNRLAAKIKDTRKKAGLTEKELAKKCGLSVGYIIQIESGKKIINEKLAEKILSSLGTKEEFLQEDKEPEVKKQKAVVQQQRIIAEPNQTWKSALAGVIEKYGIYDMQTNKVVGHKELPIIDKKVEGHKPDKLMFFRVGNDDMKHFRILKGDVVTIIKTSDIKNYGLYIVEQKGKKHIRQIAQDANNTIKLQTSPNDTDPIKIGIGNIKILGRIIKNEFVI